MDIGTHQLHLVVVTGDTELSGNRVRLVDVDGDDDLDLFLATYRLDGGLNGVWLNTTK